MKLAEARTWPLLVTTARCFGSNEIAKLVVEHATVPVPTPAVLPKPTARTATPMAATASRSI